MAAALTNPVAIVDCAPGNLVTLAGSGLTPGAGASVELMGQGAVAPLSIVPLSSTFAGDGSNVSFVIPDGARSGPLVITASDASTVALQLRITSQYLQASEYIGEGSDLSGLAPGELDTVLRKASSYADTWTGQGDYGLRLLQVYEEQPWPRKSGGRRIWPFRWPIVSVDSFIIKISTQQQATVNVNDIVAAPDQKYIEILSYAVASYQLLGAIQNLGLTANIVRLVYTAGYAQIDYPAQVREAVKMIATELLDYRFIQAKNLGGFASVKQGMQQYDRRAEPFAIPLPARELLRPYMSRRLA